MAGAGVLVVSWFAWFALSSPGGVQRQAAARAATLQAEAARAADAQSDPLRRGRAARALAQVAAPTGIQPIPIYAEVGGASLGEFLARHAVDGQLVLAITARPAHGLPLAGPELLGTVPAYTPLSPHRDAEPGFLAAVAVPPDGAWIALLLDGVVLDTCYVDAARTLVRFELHGDELLRRLAAPLS